MLKKRKPLSPEPLAVNALEKKILTKAMQKFVINHYCFKLYETMRKILDFNVNTILL